MAPFWKNQCFTFSNLLLPSFFSRFSASNLLTFWVKHKISSFSRSFRPAKASSISNEEITYKEQLISKRIRVTARSPLASVQQSPQCHTSLSASQNLYQWLMPSHRHRPQWSAAMENFQSFSLPLRPSIRQVGSRVKLAGSYYFLHKTSLKNSQI